MQKSTGVTPTERLLAEFGERTFLKLWSYANPLRDDGDEFCDLLAVFDNTLFIFFDRERRLHLESEQDPEIVWQRWKRNAIDRQVVTAHGAERYVRSGRKIYLDAKRETSLPIPFDPRTATIHKVIVAHGAKEACERASSQNIYGSLAVTYATPGDEESTPFHVEIDRGKVVHILDSHNMPIVLGELDTIRDFKDYLDEKVRAAARYDFLTYCGEEDLLAHYLLNFDAGQGRHVIGPRDSGEIRGVAIGEGEWHGFTRTELYRKTKHSNRVSYFWDDLIQRTCKNSLKGTLGGNSDIASGKSAIVEMVKEPRAFRRGLSQTLLDSVEQFPRDTDSARSVSLLPSSQPDVAYVFLQLRAPQAVRSSADFRDMRLHILETACGAARNKFPHLTKVIGIGIEPPVSADDPVAEDFLLLSCAAWPQERRKHYEQSNEIFHFFETKELRRSAGSFSQFVPPPHPSGRATSHKTGRNEACPCGSGRKFKKCHGRSL